MKKVFALFALVSVICTVSAQRVNETVTMFGKEQLSGFTINIDNTTADVVADALADHLESQYSLKGSNKKGYRAYENQPCSAFGEARYDIYFTTNNIGKKKNPSTQVTLVVTTGNMNCITFANDPRTARNIVTFLESFPEHVQSYKTTLRIKQLENQLANLNKERESIEKDIQKVKDKIAKNNDEAKNTTDRIEKLTADIEKMQDQFNKNHDAALKDQIATAVKDKKTLQKSQSNTQKTLLSLNGDIVKLNKKLDDNAKAIEECEKELKSLR